MNIDDMPVGQHTAMSVPEFLPEDKPSDDLASSLPLAERLTSKITKLRLEAFAELFKMFSEASDADEVFGKYASGFAKYLGDSHPGAQEKAMDCLLLLLSKGREVDVAAVASSVVEKGYTSAKTGVRAKATACLLALGQLENSSAILYDSVMGLMQSKNFKVSIAGIRALTELLSNFGNSIYPIQPALKVIVPQAGSTNSGIRTESMNYFKEAYRWIREGLFPALSTLKESQQEELKAFCSALAPAAAQPCLFTNSKLPAKSSESFKPPPKPRKSEAAATLSRFNEEWCENLLQTKKWSDKRDMLEEVMKVLGDEGARLESYGSVAQCLKKLLDNSNIVVVNAALKCLGLLAAALKGALAPFARNALGPVVQKCKDKKTLAEALRCMDLFTESLNISEILDDIKEMLGDRSPLVKQHVCAWVERTVVGRMSAEDVQLVAPVLCRLTDDASSEVRDAALSCVAATKAAHHSPVLNKMVKEMIQQKQEKIEQIVARITGKARDPEPMETGLPEESARPKVAEPAKMKEKKCAAAKTAGAAEESLEEATQLLAEKFPLEALEGLAKNNWKEKHQSLQTIGQLLEARNDLEPQYINALASLLTVRLKNFKESNLVVLKEGIHILATIASTHTLTSKFSNTVVIGGLIEKLGDLKVTEPVSELLLLIADSVAPKQIVMAIMKSVGSTKNPNTLKGSLALIDRFLKEFASPLLPLKAVIEFSKQYVSHSNTQVRNNAIAILCKVYSEIGDPIKPLLTSELKDSTLRALEAELGKTLVEKAEYEVARNIRGETEKEWQLKKSSKATVMDTLMPRTNIAPLITSKVLNGLTNSGMKQRQEAKEALEKILFAANFRIQPAGLSPLFNALKTRMNEPCKNLAKTFISLVGTLAAAMGSGARQYSKIILQPLLYNLADKQTAIRAETLAALDKFAEAAGADCVVNPAATLLEKDNPEMRTGILKWILNHKQGLEKADTGVLIRGLVSCMQDRAKDIRTMAEECIGETVPLAGHEAFMDAIKDLKPTVRESLKAVLGKYRLMVPCSQARPEPMEDSPGGEFPPLRPDQSGEMGGRVVDLKLKKEMESSYVNKEEEKVKEVKEHVFIKKETEVKRESVQTLLSSALSSFEIIKVLDEKIKTDPNSLLSEATHVFRWLSLKISINILNKPASDFLYSFFSLFAANHMVLSDADANIILPIICDKFSGRSELFSLLCSGVYPAAKVVYFLCRPLEYASPNVKLDCLANVKHILISQGKPAMEYMELKLFAGLLSAGEESLKSEALKVMGEVYKVIGESVWTQLADIADTQRTQLKLLFSSIGSENNIIKSLKKCSIAEKSESATRKSSALKRSASRMLKIESLEECLEQLKYEEISNKIDALIYVGEKATFAMDGVSDLIPMHCNEVIGAFTEVMKGLFNMGFDEVHLRFIKYFMNVINKICSSKVIVENLAEPELYGIIEQLLTKLLFDGLEQLGPNNEGETLMKCINSTILRLLENCQSTRVYCVLISLLKLYTLSPSPNPLLAPAMSAKFPGLIVKCLLKLTKVIEQLLPSIDLARVLLAIHEFLIALPPHPSSSNEEIASRIIKTIINEVVKVKREHIWEAYKEVQRHRTPDTHIERWIKVILKSLQGPAGDQSKRPLAENSEVLAECKNRLAALQTGGDIYERINQFKMRMLSNMQKKAN